MKLRIALSTATAIGLLPLTGAAWAGNNNHVYLQQNGSGNQASVQQSAGPGGNDIGSLATPFLQQGDNNTFTETQATGGGFSHGDNDILVGRQIGNGNAFSSSYSNNAGGNRINDALQQGNGNTLSIGRNAATNSTVGTVAQIGGSNFMKISQNGSANTVENASQLGDHNGASTVNAQNWGTLIGQSGTNNRIVEATIDGDNNNPTIWNTTYGPVQQITQTGTGNGSSNSTAITLGSNGNFIHVTENGAGNQFDVRQGTDRNSTDNQVTLLQTGSDNWATVTQTGDHNTSTLTFNGNFNGFGTGGGFSGSFDARGLTQGTVVQDNTGAATNLVAYNVLGNGNLFAFKQVGSGNTVGGHVGGGSNSDNNQVAVLQSGSGNGTTFSQTGSGSNSLSVSQ